MVDSGYVGLGEISVRRSRYSFIEATGSVSLEAELRDLEEE